jgi:hypothetical protein
VGRDGGEILYTAHGINRTGEKGGRGSGRGRQWGSKGEEVGGSDMGTNVASLLEVKNWNFRWEKKSDSLIMRALKPYS